MPALEAHVGLNTAFTRAEAAGVRQLFQCRDGRATHQPDLHLSRLADDGTAGSVTFHDSCYMARYNGVIAAPRDVLGAVPGLELREMEKSGKSTFCCGAGGGRMWMEETRGTRINAERAREALATGAEAVAVGWPFCMTMLGDGLAADPANGAGVTTLDLAEILAPVAVAGPAARRTGRELPVLP